MNASHMEPWFLLAVYCALILLASLAGGWMMIWLRPTHIRLQLSTSFVGGLMLGVGLLHLLPHAWHELHSIDRAAWWMMGGFLTMFFIQRFLQFHHHDVAEGDEDEEPVSGHHHHHEGCQHAHSLAEHSARRLSWGGAFVGLALHSLLDAASVAAAVQAESHGHGVALAGLGTFLVVVLHKPFDAIAVSALMAREGRSRKMTHLVNGLLALAVPLGMLLFHIGLTRSGGSFLGAALAFSAGTFLCIAASDLLPELQFHAHDRGKLSLALLAGLALAVLIGKFETTGHDHLPSQPEKPAVESLDHDGHQH